MIQAQEKSYGSFQDVLSGGDGAVVSRLGIAVRFEDGNDGFCFMEVYCVAGCCGEEVKLFN